MQQSLGAEGGDECRLGAILSLYRFGLDRGQGECLGQIGGQIGDHAVEKLVRRVAASDKRHVRVREGYRSAAETFQRRDGRDRRLGPERGRGAEAKLAIRLAGDAGFRGGGENAVAPCFRIRGAGVEARARVVDHEPQCVRCNDPTRSRDVEREGDALRSGFGKRDLDVALALLAVDGGRDFHAARGDGYLRARQFVDRAQRVGQRRLPAVRDGIVRAFEKIGQSGVAGDPRDGSPYRVPIRGRGRQADQRYAGIVAQHLDGEFGRRDLFSRANPYLVDHSSGIHDAAGEIERVEPGRLVRSGARQPDLQAVDRNLGPEQALLEQEFGHAVPGGALDKVRCENRGAHCEQRPDAQCRRCQDMCNDAHHRFAFAKLTPLCMPVAAHPQSRHQRYGEKQRRRQTGLAVRAEQRQASFGIVDVEPANLPGH